MKLSASARSRILKISTLGLIILLLKKASFIELFKEYKDVFAWTYDYLKTYDTKIIQHIIQLKEYAKPFQQKLWKMHLSLELLVKKELNKLLAAKIILSLGKCFKKYKYV